MAQLDLDMEDLMKGGITDITFLSFYNTNLRNISTIIFKILYKELRLYCILGGKKEEPPPAAEEPNPAEDEAKKKKDKKKKKKSETGSEADEKIEGVDNMSTVKENENDEVFEEAKEGGMNTSLTALSIIQLNLRYFRNTTNQQIFIPLNHIKLEKVMFSYGVEYCLNDNILIYFISI